jgi:hypothetical protein
MATSSVVTQRQNWVQPCWIASRKSIAGEITIRVTVPWTNDYLNSQFLKQRWIFRVSPDDSWIGTPSRVQYLFEFLTFNSRPLGRTIHTVSEFMVAESWRGNSFWKSYVQGIFTSHNLLTCSIQWSLSGRHNIFPGYRKHPQG